MYTYIHDIQLLKLTRSRLAHGQLLYIHTYIYTYRVHRPQGCQGKHVISYYTYIHTYTHTHVYIHTCIHTEYTNIPPPRLSRQARDQRLKRFAQRHTYTNTHTYMNICYFTHINAYIHVYIPSTPPPRLSRQARDQRLKRFAERRHHHCPQQPPSEFAAFCVYVYICMYVCTYLCMYVYI